MEFGRQGEDAVHRVVRDLGDRLGGFFVRGGLGSGEIHAGDLQAVEEKTGAARVELVGGKFVEDLADGVLDGGAVLGRGESEGGVAAAAWSGVLRTARCGAARGVVVVAELFAPKCGTAAAAAVGEQVTALEASGFGVVHVQGGPLPGCLVQSLQERRVKSGLLVSQVWTVGLGLKGERLPGV